MLLLLLSRLGKNKMSREASLAMLLLCRTQHSQLHLLLRSRTLDIPVSIFISPSASSYLIFRCISIGRGVRQSSGQWFAFTGRHGLRRKMQLSTLEEINMLFTSQQSPPTYVIQIESRQSPNLIANTNVSRVNTGFILHPESGLS